MKLSFLMPDRSKFRELLHSTSNLIRESPADGETISFSRKKAHEAQSKPHFLMVYRPQETVPK